MRKDLEDYKGLTTPMGLYNIGHSIGQGLGWLGFWLMIGIISYSLAITEIAKG